MSNKFRRKDIIPLNSTPVAVLEFTDFLSNDEKSIITNNVAYENQGYNRVEVSTSYTLFEEYNLESLEKKFKECVDIYVKEVLEASLDFKLTGSWCTRNETNSNHQVHSHPNVFLSVVTYFNNNNEDIAEIVFHPKGLHSVFPNFIMEYQERHFNNWNIFNSQSWSIKPTKNSVIVFPGNLLHSSKVNLNTSPRYCIGANYFITGSFGSNRTFTSLSL
jgi:hypothetical protein